VSFYLTTSNVDTLSENLISNEGTLLGTLGTFELGGDMPSILSLNGTAITYNASEGNLLMDVVVTDPTVVYPYYSSFFNADFEKIEVARAVNASTRDFGGLDEALQTTFSLTVPEPSTWGMMLIGFAGIGFAGYRASRRTAAAA
jgi:PEP-CTERM motif